MKISLLLTSLFISLSVTAPIWAQKATPTENLASSSDSKDLRHWKYEQGNFLILADKVEKTQTQGDSVSYKGTGNVVATIGGQDSKIEADSVIFESETGLFQAKGNVHLFRNGCELTANFTQFKIDEPENLITTPGVKISAPELKQRTEPPTISAPAPGPQFFDRRTLYQSIVTADKAGIQVGRYKEDYLTIEEMACDKIADFELQRRMDSVRNALALQLGTKMDLKDQLYAIGPLDAICRDIERQLKSGWAKTKGFEDIVWLFGVVQPDGSITEVVTDDPARYGETVNDIAVSKVKSIKVAVPPREPYPLVIEMSNNPREVMVYIRGLNFEPFWVAFETRLKKNWEAVKMPPGKKVTVQYTITRDGKVVYARVSYSSGDKNIDAKAIEVVKNSAGFSPLPDGACTHTSSEYTLGSSSMKHRYVFNLQNEIVELDRKIEVAKQLGTGIQPFVSKLNAIKESAKKGGSLEPASREISALNLLLDKQFVETRMLKAGFKPSEIGLMRGATFDDDTAAVKMITAQGYRFLKLPNKPVFLKARVTILRNGKVAACWIEKSSGDKVVDSQTLQQLRSAAPYKYPEHIVEDNITVEFTVNNSRKAEKNKHN